MKRQVSFTIHSQIYSLKNSRIYGRGRAIKHPKALLFEQAFLAQVPREYVGLMMGSREQFLWARVEIVYPTWKQDVSAEAVFDLLQKAQIVSNDRWIRSQFVTGLVVNKEDPMVHISIGEL